MDKRTGSKVHAGGSLVFKSATIKDGNVGKKVRSTTDGTLPASRNDALVRSARWHSKKAEPSPSY